MSGFFSNLRQSSSKKIITGLIILCVITWGFTGIATYNLITSDNPPATAQTEITSPATENLTVQEDIPVISDIEVVDIAESSAAIVWITDIPSTSEVEYWIEGTDNRTISEDKGLSLNHRIELDNLAAGDYSYLVKSVNLSGMESVSPGNFSMTEEAALESPEVGYIAPDFSLEDMDGNTVTLSDLRDKWVMLVFWETTCSSCREEIPEINSYSKRMPVDKIRVVTVNVNSANDLLLASFVKSKNIDLPVLMDRDGAVSNSYLIMQYPTTFFIDTDGVVQMVLEQRFRSTDTMAAAVTSLVGN